MRGHPLPRLLCLLALFFALGCQRRPPPPTPAPKAAPAPSPLGGATPRGRGGGPELVASDKRFLNTILPILHRHGCSGGTCHGDTRKGGFLFNGISADEQRAVLARVDRAHPEQSQLLQKALGKVEHNGGRNLDERSCDAKMLVAWIAGAPDPGCDRPTERAAREQAQAQRFAREVAPALTALGCAAAACHGTAPMNRMPGQRGLDLSGLVADPPRPSDALQAVIASGLNRQAVWMSAVMKAVRGQDGRPQHPATDFASCAARRLYSFIAEAPEERCALGHEEGRRPRFEDFAAVVLPHLLRRGCAEGSCHGGGAGGMSLFDAATDQQVVQHDYLTLLARVEDLRQPEASTLLRTARNQEPHGGGRRLGGAQKGDCIDQLLVDWLRGRPVHACAPPQPPSLASYAATMQPLIDHMTCSQARCHGAGVGDFWLKAGATGEDLRKNYEQVLKHVDYDYVPFSGIILRMREVCAFAITSAWIEKRPAPRCKPGKIDPALFPKLPGEVTPL